MHYCYHLDLEQNHPILQDEVEREYARLTTVSCVSAILSRLRNELPSSLVFHSYSHTEEVIKEALLFALYDGISTRERELLTFAAAFHDAGFLLQRDDHESSGAEFARIALRAEGMCTHSEINIVTEAIHDTRLVQTESGPKQLPRSLLSRYLADADTSNFGRKDFFEKVELARKEFGDDTAEYLDRTHKLLLCHQWYTNAARDLREQQKTANLEQLRTMLVC